MAELIEFETDRLRLRQWQESDLESFAALNADPKVMKYFPEPLSCQESNEMAEKIRSLIMERGWGFWALEVKGAESFVGFCGLHIPIATLPFSPVCRDWLAVIVSPLGKRLCIRGCSRCAKYCI